MKNNTNTRGVQISETTLNTFLNNQEVLIGTLLGDASFQTYSDGKTWRLRYLQKNEKYLRHLYEIWESFTGTPPKAIKDRDGNTRWYFNTLTFAGFTDIANKFYIRNHKGIWVKTVPKDIQISAKSLAYWYMDDGSKKSNVNAYYLCTDAFNKVDLDTLRKVLKENWGIVVNYHKTEKNNIRLYIPAKYGYQFKKLIENYV